MVLENEIHKETFHINNGNININSDNVDKATKHHSRSPRGLRHKPKTNE